MRLSWPWKARQASDRDSNTPAAHPWFRAKGGYMPNHDRSAAYSDTEILDLIEDFLVNHFAVDERQNIPQGPAFAMLEHIADLLDLRRGNSQHRGSGPSARLPRVTESHACPYLQPPLLYTECHASPL